MSVPVLFEFAPLKQLAIVAVENVNRLGSVDLKQEIRFRIYVEMSDLVR